MKLPDVLATVRDRPSMVIGSSRYRDAVSWLLGYDSGVNVLGGFREWLIPQVDDMNNFAWPGLVRELMRRQASPARIQSRDDHAAAIRFLFGTVERFLRDRGENDGL